MKPADVAAARRKLNATPGQFAELVGVSSQTVSGWEAGSRPGPTPWQSTLIRALTVSPRAAEIVRCLSANGLASAFAIGLEAALMDAEAHAAARLSAADTEAQRPNPVPVTTTSAKVAELFA